MPVSGGVAPAGVKDWCQINPGSTLAGRRDQLRHIGHRRKSAAPPKVENKKMQSKNYLFMIFQIDDNSIPILTSFQPQIKHF